MAINPLDSGVRGIITNPRIQSELNLAQRLTLRAFLRPFADALDGDPKQTSCEESVSASSKLPSLWAQLLKTSTVRVTSGMGVMYISQGLVPRAHAGP